MTAQEHAPGPAQAVRAAIEQMLGTVAMARALVEGGRRVDLAGLDRDAAALCAAAMALPAEQGRALRGPLEALRRQVDGLRQDLVRAGG